ncbi:toprim domain-containing protein [Bradyrhizobium sp. S3.5.5]|uniref:DUF7146 domain-containing protein n=1 Tax=Bradyrhizobium sp. S3.5.5 TaxID=3156430 RepID=UPI003398CC62
MLTAEQIARARAVSVGDVATERGMEFRNGEYVGPCPHCGGDDRFSISNRKGLFLCRQCHPKGGGGGIALVMFLDGVGFREAVETLIGECASRRKSTVPNGTLEKLTGQDGKGTAYAQKIWRDSIDPRGTLAEQYLNGRGLGLDDDLAIRVFRFHARCPFGRDDAGAPIYVPALLAAFRPTRNDDESRPPQAIHRIGLNADGGKISKLMLGAVGGCAVKIDPDDMVEGGLGICEGIETGLAIRATGWRPLWALGSAGAMAKLVPIPGVECLTIFADNDAADPKTGKRPGQDAAWQCAQAWQAAGCEVIIHMRDVLGRDFADE